MSLFSCQQSSQSLLQTPDFWLGGRQSAKDIFDSGLDFGGTVLEVGVKEGVVFKKQRGVEEFTSLGFLVRDEVANQNSNLVE